MSEYEGKYDRRLLARMRQVEAERAELLKDRERLEWYAMCCEWLQYSETTQGWYVTGYGCPHHDDWREAIDAAMLAAREAGDVAE